MTNEDESVRFVFKNFRWIDWFRVSVWSVYAVTMIAIGLNVLHHPEMIKGREPILKLDSYKKDPH